MEANIPTVGISGLLTSRDQVDLPDPVQAGFLAVIAIQVMFHNCRTM